MSDNREDHFINYYMSNRVMRKTHDPNALHQIYATKYEIWIIPFLKQYGVENAPSLLCCNTLHKLPDFFRLQPHSFFISDYYLYSYFYDFNYALSDNKRNDLTINILLKAFIEQAYVSGHIDLSYSLARTSPDVEAYKKTNEYKNHNIATGLVKKTDLQEALTFLHEATHYLCKRESGTSIDDILNAMSRFRCITILGLNSKTLEECYCDYRSVTSLLKTTYHLNEWQREQYFEIIFLTLIYIYTFQFSRVAPSITVSEYSSYIDQEMKLLWHRFGGMHAYILDYLLMSNEVGDIDVLNSSFQKCTDIFKEIGAKTRMIFEYAKCEGEINSHLFENISKGQKVDYLKYFLKLLS